MRWHNAGTRRSPNPHPKYSLEPATVNRESAAHCILDRSDQLRHRPYTSAQTKLSLSLFACDKSADHIRLDSGQPVQNITARPKKPTRPEAWPTLRRNIRSLSILRSLARRVRKRLSNKAGHGDDQSQQGLRGRYYADLQAEMGRFDEELVKAGVLLAADGLQPSSKDQRGSRERSGPDRSSDRKIDSGKASFQLKT